MTAPGTLTNNESLVKTPPTVSNARCTRSPTRRVQDCSDVVT